PLALYVGIVSGDLRRKNERSRSSNGLPACRFLDGRGRRARTRSSTQAKRHFHSSHFY
ncbi:257_t:CDS:1, partial [Acaulospora colombiana]